jgi:hypothetical protein
MNSKQTVPLIATLAPALAVAPPLLIGAAIGLGILWLLSKKQDAATPPLAPETPAPALSLQIEPEAPAPVSRQTKPAPKRITREDLAEALEYGVRYMALGEAVTALQSFGFGKTAAYKALSANSKFGSLLEFTPDGLIEWKG